jgi:hypothetical protein
MAAPVRYTWRQRRLLESELKLLMLTIQQFLFRHVGRILYESSFGVTVSTVLELFSQLVAILLNPNPNPNKPRGDSATP